VFTEKYMISFFQPPLQSKSLPRKLAALVMVMLVAAIGCSSSLPGTGFVTSLPPATTTSISPETANQLSWLQVFFTDPNPPDNRGQGIDGYVVPVLDAATTSIDAASLDFNLPAVVNALARASLRGVKVRVVYDGENGNLELDNTLTDYQAFDTILALKSARVGLVDDGRNNGLMHDKFLIVDGNVLFTGSWNFSYNDTYRNNNNLLEITDARLVANYLAKFDELYIDHNYGSRAEVQVPYPSLSIDGVQVENYFAPEDNVMDKIIAEVQAASRSVHFMAYSYTHHDLADAMIERMHSGVQVQGVIETRDSGYGVLGDLFCAGVTVKNDGNPYNMHHKVIIIDGETIITGSFNFTKSADTINDENVLVIHSPAVATLYEQEFQRIYAVGEMPEVSIQCK
jgi:phosphatidylserine/phosphatidylglycerophosphate/cardiolipin synthase-like enzyme